ncbi:diguanylate cyclase domain-containing protein [Pleionea litopenaei]|uniref:Diguanylate cyclase n=1 Tax=Pleionea litopenaei TaxID=3070815 RepID=A0AA51X9A6_9GAMM|nr:diguanylate cyclase [Pleionea sp. HL-JVS1]WMS88975.1 diguanylate cyclase [Pleionea sp. HL-JVS1]
MSGIHSALVRMEATNLNKEFLWSLFECLQEGVFAIGDDRFILANPALCELLGYSREELVGKRFLEVIAERHRDMVTQRAKARINGENPPNHYEIALIRSDAAELLVHIKVSTFMLADGSIVNVGSTRDISAERRALKQLQYSEQEFRRIVENLPDIFYRTDAKGSIVMASPYAAKVMGYELEELIGQPLADFYARPEEREAALSKILQGKGTMVPVESCLRHRDGSIVWVSTHAYARYDEDGQLIGVEGVARNITERKSLEERLRHMAIRDPLTQVYNRFGFEEKLDDAINRARRNRSSIALLFFDLDKFKTINDNYGHDVGDRYLAAFAKRMEIGFRDTDTIARLGGDEFVALLENLEHDEMVYNLLERCVTALSDPFVSEDCSLPFNYSYGIAQYPKHGKDAETLLKWADQAMYLDKNSH